MSIEENQGLSFGFESDSATDQAIELLSILARDAFRMAFLSEEIQLGETGL